MIEQTRENQRQKALIDQARLNVAQMKDEARARLLSERQQWKNELAGGVLDTVSASFNGIMQGIEDKKVSEAVSGFLANKGAQSIADLDDEGLNGLLSTLMLARMGYNANPVASVASNVLDTGKEVLPQKTKPELMKPTSQLANLKQDYAQIRTARQELENTAAQFQPEPVSTPVPAFNMDAFNAIANKPAYQTMLQVLNDQYNGDVNSPDFRAWVNRTYTARGTLDKFLRAYNAGMGGQ